MRVPAIAVLPAFAALALGCSLGAPPTVVPPPNQVVADGVAAGVRWRLTYERNDDQDCLFVDYPGTSPRTTGGCFQPLAGQELIWTGSADGTDLPTVFFGFAGADVSGVRVKIRGGEQFVEPAPLTSGPWMRAFAAAFAPLASLTSIEGLDGQGNVVFHEAPR